METDIQKIKDLFNSSNIANHSIAYMLCKSQFNMNDNEICSLVLNDGGGWKLTIDDFYHIVEYKTLFNGNLEYVIPKINTSSQEIIISFNFFISNVHFTTIRMYSNNHLNRQDDYKISNWFSKLTK